jgi:hypothetical protein
MGGEEKKRTENEERGMRKFIIGGIAAIVLALGFTASNASAAWVRRTVYRWDPVYAAYVPVIQRVWVPDPVAYVPSYYSYYPDYYAYRPWYFPGYYRHHYHDHHHHDHDHHHHH